MTRHIRTFHMILMAVLVLSMGTTVPQVSADDDDEIPFDVATIFFELNNTDGDLGIHALIDGDPWKRLKIEDPNERSMLDIRVNGRLKKQGLTELFFESAEPTFDELDPEDFFKRFPEGEYEIEGETLDGEELESTAEITHLLPAPAGGIEVGDTPTSIDPDAVDCDVDTPDVTPDANGDVVISWNAVSLSHPELGRTNEPITVVRYQVVVEHEDTESVLSVILPPSDTSLTVPAVFLALGDEFKFEILVRETSGNQTAVESCFEVS